MRVSLSHSHGMLFQLISDRARYDVARCPFLRSVHAPVGSRANISNDVAQTMKQQRHFDETAAAAGGKHDTIDIREAVNEVGSRVLACSCNCDLFF